MSTPAPHPVRKRRRTRPFLFEHSRLLAILAATAAAIVVYFIINPPGSRHRLIGYIGDVGSLRTEYPHFMGKPLKAMEIQQQFEQATAFVDKGDYRRATELLKGTARQAPLPVVFNDLGVLYAQLNDLSRAANAFREALARDAAYGPARSNIRRLKGLSEHMADPVSTEIEPNDSVQSANLLAMDYPVEAEITDPEDRDYFRFTSPPEPRDRLEISLVNRSKTLAPILRVYDERGLLLPVGNQQHKRGESFSLIIAPAPNTTMFLGVFGGEDSFGGYTLTIKALKSFDRYEPNDDIYSARKIALGQQIDANIMDSDDTDFYSFESPRNGTVSIDIQNHSSTLVPALTTFTPDMRTSGFGPDVYRPGASLYHAIPVQEGRTYWIQVWPRANTSGEYSLIVH